MTKCSHQELVALYEEWADLFLQEPQHPLSNEDATIYIQLMMMEKAGEPVDEAPMEKSTSYQVVSHRAKIAGLNPSVILKMWIASISPTPGMAVMLIYVLRKKMHDLKQTQATLDTFVAAFPWGLPTEQKLSAIWDAQKARGIGLSDNLLDYIADPYPV